MRLLTTALLTIAALFTLPAYSDVLYVTEWRGAPPTSVYYQAVSAPAVTTQAVAISASSAQSAAFDTLTGIIRVHADVACHVVIGGTNPTATTSSMMMGAGQTEYFVVKPGDKVAVILAAEAP